MTAVTDLAQIIAQTEVGCDIPVTAKPWHLTAARRYLGAPQPGWHIPGTIWHWQTNPDHQPDAWWTAFNRQLRQAATRRP